jgi:arylsulfatase A
LLPASRCSRRALLHDATRKPIFSYQQIKLTLLEFFAERSQNGPTMNATLSSFFRTLPVIYLSILIGLLATRGQDAPPNIILFLADDQGWTGTSVQMDKNDPRSRSDFYETPALERLASQGMRFSQAYSPHPNCSSTRMSIQTGKSPARIGTTDIYDVNPGTPGFIQPFYEMFYLNKPLIMHLPIVGLPENEITIAEFVKRHNPEYVFGHFGKWHMGPKDPSVHGYDWSDGPTTNKEGNLETEDPKEIYTVTEKAVRFLQRQSARKTPFFLQVSHYAVHTAIQAKPETMGKYRTATPGERHTNAGYGAMTEDLDDSLRILMEALDELNLTDNTYVFYTSDNGGEVQDGSSPTNNIPLRKGKTHTWEGGIRVPFIARGPGIAPDSQSDAPINGSDLFATFADLTGIDASLPDNQDGGSLAGLLKRGGEGDVERGVDHFVWYYPHYRNMKDVFPQASIRYGDYKLRKEYDTNTIMLFDLSKDLGESKDLSPTKPDLAAQLHKRLNDYLADIGAKVPAKNSNYDPKLDKGLNNRTFFNRAPQGNSRN